MGIAPIEGYTDPIWSPLRLADRVLLVPEPPNEIAIVDARRLAESVCHGGAMIRDLKFLTDDASHAAEYLRKSTDHQKYSIENQADTIRRYAEIRGFTIVRTYADDGKSGLTINGRPALRRLIQDVRSGRANFQTILVYDVSRWGRFQDADESAYHEFLCKLAGIKVEYCAEQFENDGTPISTIIKGMKRAMAGEYSRELSVKVFDGFRAGPFESPVS